jgi:VanZ family protein
VVPKPSRIVAWVAVLAWCGVIFWFSSIPSLGTGLGFWDLLLRKAAHMTEYAILMLLLLRTQIPVWLALTLGVLYATSDEWHQTYVEGRAGRPLDVLIDTIGLLLGVVVARRLARGRLAT